MGNIGPKQPRTLRRRLAMQIGLMIGALLIFAVAAIVGIDGLGHDFGDALSGYQQLRTAYEIGSSVAAARTAVRSDQTEIARSAIQAAMLRLETSSDLNHSDQQVKLLAADLREAARTLDAASLDAALGRLATFSSEIRTSIENHQLAANRKQRITLILVLSLSVLMVVSGIVIGLQQYRSVMRPLRRLEEAVQKVSAGRFGQPIETTGDREFVALANDFNRMAGELDALYRNLEEQVAAKSKELVRSERLASVGFLAAGVAHEINNPLSIITGYGERALRQLDAEGRSLASQSTRKAIEVMCEEAYRCKQITDRLLSLARGGEETFGRVDLSSLVQETVNNVTALPEYQNRRIVIESDVRHANLIRAREGEIKQVILNLLINAQQAISGETGEIAIQIGGDGDMVELNIRDNGLGMTSQTLDRIFEPFYTTQRGSKRGTGLGLSITHAIIAAHGGTIRAQSAGPGSGSTFTIRLPAMNEGGTHVEQH